MTLSKSAIYSRQLMTSTLVTKRWKVTATAPAAVGAEEEWNAAKPYDQIPGARSLPILGTMWAAIGSGVDVTRLHLLQDINYKKYGPIWRDKFPGLPPMVALTRPEDIEKLFRCEGKFPERPELEMLTLYRQKRVEHFTSNGILNGNGEDWWRIRSKAQQPFLKTSNIEYYLPALSDIAEEFMERIRLIRQDNNEMRPDFINEMYKWALESVAVVGLNTRLGCFDPNLSHDSEAQKMISAANASMRSMNDLAFGLPLWKYVTTPTLRQLFDSQDFFIETAVKYINKTLDAIKNRGASSGASEDEHSILEDLLIRGMSPKDAMVMVVDMLLAGIDTTSHTTSFLLYFLAKNPEKQEKLRNEILSVVGPKGSRFKFQKLDELRYLKACVKESLRMMPAVMGNGRIIDKDIVLSGFRVPKGTMAVLIHQLIGQSDEYFPNAKTFLPERWIRGDPQESHHHPYALLPFGFGLRMCLGRRLAELEMWQLTITILQNFKVEYHYGEMGCFTRLVLVPDQPLRFRFIDL